MIQVNSGVTLTLDTNEAVVSNYILSVGNLPAASGSTYTLAKITGSGSLVINEITSNISVTNGSTNNQSYATLDLSGLANFSASVAGFYMGDGTRANGTVYLAGTNSLTLDVLGVGRSAGSSEPAKGTLYLGRTNNLNVDVINVGATDQSGQSNTASGLMQFQTFSAGIIPTVTIRGKESTEENPTRANLTIGSHGSTATSGSITATVDFTAGSVDALLGDIVIADALGIYSNSSKSGKVTGTLSMASGIIDARSIIIGRTNTGSTTSALSNATAALNIYGGKFTTGSMILANNAGGGQIVNGSLNVFGKGTVELLQSVDGVGTTGNITLGSKSGTATSVTGTINLSSNGSLKVGGNIAEGSSPAGVTSVINLKGGVLDMDGGSISVDTFTLLGGTLKNLAALKDGSGASNQTLVKSGNGTLILAGSNDYAGGTSITGGVLLAESGALSANGSVLISNGAALALNYSNIQNTLNTLVADASTGSIALSWQNASEDVDFSAAGLSSAFLGAYGHVVYTGDFTPASSGVYRFGGGSGTLDYTAALGLGDSVVIGGGSGTVILSGDNDYDGGTTLLAGVLQLTGLDDLGTGNNDLTFNGGTLQWGTGVSADISSGGRTVAIGSGGATLDTNGNNVTLASAIGDDGLGGLTKLGSGTLTLQGNNTFTGPVTVTSGTLALDLGAHSTGVINSTSALNLSGGILQVLGASTSTSSQTLGNVALTGASRIILSANGGSNTTLTLGNTWTRSTGATLALTLGANTTLTSDPSAHLQNGILPYATVNGTDLATISGGNIVAYTGYTVQTSGTNLQANDPLTTALINYRLEYSGASNSITINPLENDAYINSITIGNANSYTLGLTSNRKLHLGVLGTLYMVNGAGALTIGGTGNTNIGVTAGGPTTNTGGELLLINESSSLMTIRAVSNNGTSGIVSLTKSGTGTTVIGGGASISGYTGITTINEGTLSVGVVANGGTASDLGAATNAASNLVFNGGALRYTGTGGSTDRLFTLGLNGGTIESTGTGAVKFTSYESLGYSGSGARKLTLAGTNTGDNTLAAWIGDNGGSTSVTKSGTGKWILSGYNDYSGDTVVTAGTLIVNGSIGGGSAVSVKNAATLGGNGVIHGSVSVESGATLSPGDSSNASLGVGNVSLASGGNVSLSLDGSAASGYDQLAVTGTVDLADGSNLVLALNYAPAEGQTFTLISNDGSDAINGIFTTVNGVAVGLGNTFSLVYNSITYDARLLYSGEGTSLTGGNDLVLQVIPEPAPLALLLSVLGVWLVVRRRRSAA